ncbi:MAG: spore coat protein CotH [Ruminiclostridium sp.]|nr:spore coat protein CotH [Ruminiclostridium sp.]
MKRNRIKRTIILFYYIVTAAGILFFHTGCAIDDTIQPVQPFMAATAVEKEPVPDIDSVSLQDNKAIYLSDNHGSVITMYLTVRRGNPADSTDYSWEEVNRYSVTDYIEMGVERYGVEAILQVGDDNGPVPGELGYNEIIPNAVVNIRGATSSSHVQKSYKISLMENSEPWRGQKTIALNKHVYDNVRFRNKLSYDYIKQIPDMIGLRTQFVHLYVKDETNKVKNTKFVDYGLFTQVELPNKTYLKKHGLDSNGQLYKATFFEFGCYESNLWLKTDPAYDEVLFNKILETKGNEDHTKLLEMLDAVNDYGISIESTFEKYFDADNYFTWLAFNILTGNVDTQSQNYYLYSPTNGNKWYFISWDNDTAWMRCEDSKITVDTGFETGIMNYWGSILHKRVLALPKYRELLNEKILRLREFITVEKTRAMIDTYKPVVLQYSFRMPDSMHIKVNEKQFIDICNEIPYEAERNYSLYLDSLEKPMPFYLNPPEVIDGTKLRFSWEAAYDLDAESITYTFELCRDYLFEVPIQIVSDLEVPVMETDILPPGQYFYRVTAKNSSGYSQTAFDYYVNVKHVKHYGTKCFYVFEDGKAVVRKEVK